jgi:hypothetical protein
LYLSGKTKKKILQSVIFEKYSQHGGHYRKGEDYLHSIGGEEIKGTQA